MFAFLTQSRIKIAVNVLILLGSIVYEANQQQYKKKQQGLAEDGPRDQPQLGKS